MSTKNKTEMVKNGIILSSLCLMLPLSCKICEKDFPCKWTSYWKTKEQLENL